MIKSTRKTSEEKIRAWLSKCDATLDDMGFDGELEQLSDADIQELLDDIAEDEARAMNDELILQESYEFMDGEDHG